MNSSPWVFISFCLEQILAVVPFFFLIYGLIDAKCCDSSNKSFFFFQQVFCMNGGEKMNSAMSEEPDALSVVNQLRDLAADPLNRRAIVQDQGCLPGLILFLDHPNPQVVHSALLVSILEINCYVGRAFSNFVKQVVETSSLQTKLFKQFV